ncbi:MAG TPA: nucleoside hydrolase, partial [Parafilimonas sp.]|nr:nucleoside hydrolase [Parafilimonas sp.]
VLVGVMGYDKWYNVKRGKIVISDKDGSNTWVDDENGKQAYLVEKVSPEIVQKLINELIQHQPK